MQMDPARHARIARGLLACVIIVGSLVLWTGIPAGWMYATSGLVDQGTRFVLVILGVPLTMALVFMLLSWVDAYRRRLGPESESEPERSGPAQNATAKGPSLLEVMLVVSGVIALVALVLWWFFIADAADPSGPLQPI